MADEYRRYASVNSTSAHTPRATPGHLFRFSVPGVGHLCVPWRPPGNLIHAVSKPSKDRAAELRVLFLRDRGFRGKRYGSRVTVACPRRTS